MANINTLELDFTGVESFSNIPVGRHSVRIKDAIFGKASTGSSQLEVTFEDENGATKKAWYNLQPQALWKVKILLEAIGLQADGKVRLNTSQIKGKNCIITIDEDPNDSERTIVARVERLTNEIKTEVPFSAPAQAPAEPAQQPVNNLPPWMQQPAPAQAPAEPAQQPVNNLPPWMQQPAPAQAPAEPAQQPVNNLPPWMQNK